MTKRDYPKEISQDEWLKRQNYFLEEQNKRLKSELAESKEYINLLINKLKYLQYYLWKRINKIILHYLLTGLLVQEW